MFEIFTFKGTPRRTTRKKKLNLDRAMHHESICVVIRVFECGGNGRAVRPLAADLIAILSYWCCNNMSLIDIGDCMERTPHSSPSYEQESAHSQGSCAPAASILLSRGDVLQIVFCSRRRTARHRISMKRRVRVDSIQPPRSWLAANALQGIGGGLDELHGLVVVEKLEGARRPHLETIPDIGGWKREAHR